MPNDNEFEAVPRGFLGKLREFIINREYLHGQKRVDYHRRIKDLSGKLGVANRRASNLEEHIDVLKEQLKHYQTINAESAPKKPVSFRKGLLWGAGLASLLYFAEPFIYDKIIKDIWAYHGKKMQQVDADVSQFTANLAKIIENYECAPKNQGQTQSLGINGTIAKSLRIPDLEGYQVTIDSRSDVN